MREIDLRTWERRDHFIACREFDQPHFGMCATDAPGRDNLLSMTPIPWVSFTSVMHPLPTRPADGNLSCRFAGRGISPDVRR